MFKKIASVTAAVLLAKTAMAQPCVPVPGATAGCTNGTIQMRINAVSTTGGIFNINNTNGTCSGGYSVYSGPGNTVTQNAGSSFTLNITLQNNTSATYNSAFPIKVSVWVDWNHNDTFKNVGYTTSPSTGELMFVTPTSFAAVTCSTSIPVPTYAKAGLTRMRIRMGTKAGTSPYNPPTLPDPCNANDHLYGEVEDYWVDVINPCLPPPVVNISSITDKSAIYAFNRRGNASFYEYYVSTVNIAPGNGNIYTTDTALFFPNSQVPIACNTKYYVFLRSICDTVGKATVADWDQSGWRVDSFTTAQCCYRPEAAVNYITSTTAIASWTPVPSVIKYEYSVNADTSMVAPTSGTLTTATSVKLMGLAPKKDYKFFVRALCSPTPYSEWKTVTFLTQPTTGIASQNATSGFELLAFPNPVKNTVTLYCNQGMRTGTPHVTITDFTGKVVGQHLLTDYEMTIDLSDKPAGLYIIKYQDDANSQVLKVTKE
jgi:hypothetical protein